MDKIFKSLVFASLAFLVNTTSVNTQNSTNSVQVKAKSVSVKDNKTVDRLMKELHGSCVGINTGMSPWNVLKYSTQLFNRVKAYREALDVKKKIAEQFQAMIDASWDSTESEQIYNAVLDESKDVCSVQDCSEIHPRTTSLHDISVGESPLFSVMCNMDVDGGNWTVLQQRQDGSVNFQRTWHEYKEGFGELEGEFWLGNEKIHQLTSSGTYELRVDLHDWEGNSWYAIYKTFKTDDEDSKYQLSVGQYSGTAGDSLKRHNKMKFSTKDQDNDIDSVRDCSNEYKGGWWYKDCHNVNLNGLYQKGSYSGYSGIHWMHTKNKGYSMKFARMMIRRY